MKLRTVLLQNVLLALGIICLYKFFSLKDYYQQILAWKEGIPILDGDGVGLTFLGLPVDDDGVHWTDIMGVANTFLGAGLILLAGAVGVLVWKSTKRLKH